MYASRPSSSNRPHTTQLALVHTMLRSNYHMLNLVRPAVINMNNKYLIRNSHFPHSTKKGKEKERKKNAQTANLAQPLGLHGRPPPPSSHEISQKHKYHFVAPATFARGTWPMSGNTRAHPIEANSPRSNRMN